MNLIVLDRTNPRAIETTVAGLRDHLSYLPGSKSIVSSLTDLKWSTDHNTDLLTEVRTLTQKGFQLSNDISHQFFLHVTEQRFTS
jgi:uncharacterized alpha-E superfamily protein